MKVGDLIHCEHDDEYGVYLHSDGFDGWITVFSEGEVMQVQGQWWKKVE